ncbi:hypothetical protein TrLO_g12989 [Triparma laevis f. longispina]|uniref:Uncharacterized protein n=1 Tax=Triparma laevis f. longispina TaxID=1714387 RepID=A0A9W7KUW6_9STRA|nr:hypothetical protein TrLO_g12989 [Triparma laevis f. longispina]
MGCMQICGGLVVFLGVIVIAVGFFLASSMLPAAIDKGLLDFQKNDLHVCDGAAAGDKGWDAFQNVNFLEDHSNTESARAYDIYYLYHITNPTAHLGGAVAKVVEVGPFVMRSWDESFDMVVGSDGLSYRYGSVHIFLDGAQIATGPGIVGITETLEEH